MTYVNRRKRRKLIKRDNTHFINWLDYNNFLYNDFDDLAKRLEDFLLNNNNYYNLCTKEKCDNVAIQLKNAYGECNDIKNYEIPGFVEAYIILHFLDRYFKFLMVCRELMKNDDFPRRKVIKALDIGTGPSPTLFALSNFIYYCNKYGECNNVPYFKNINYSFNYVETSDRFRGWLHAFCESLPRDGRWYVPFHHGSYFDYSKLNFQKMKKEEQDNIHFEKVTFKEGIYTNVARFRRQETFFNEIYNCWDSIYIDEPVKDIYIYDLIVYYNFLTTDEFVNKLNQVLPSTSRTLRTGGIITIIGAHGSGYSDIYSSIDSIFKYEIYLKKILDVSIEYNYANNYGKRLREFYSKIYGRLKSFGSDELIDNKTKDKYIERINDCSTDNRYFSLIVYKTPVPICNMPKLQNKCDILSTIKE